MRDRLVRALRRFGWWLDGRLETLARRVCRHELTDMHALTSVNGIPFTWRFCPKCDWDDAVEARDRANRLRETLDAFRTGT